MELLHWPADKKWNLPSIDIDSLHVLVSRLAYWLRLHEHPKTSRESREWDEICCSVYVKEISLLPSHTQYLHEKEEIDWKIGKKQKQFPIC